MDKIRVVHYLNQFFAGIGGEERAGAPIEVRTGPVGPGLVLQKALAPDAEVVATAICGDATFAEKADAVASELVHRIAPLHPRVVVAGPAFTAGRYGVACVELCRAVERELGIPGVTAMAPENPGVDLAEGKVLIVPTAATAAGMAPAVETLARLARKLARGEALGPAAHEGYLPRGVKHNRFAEEIGAERAARMLLARLRGEPFQTEIPLPQVEQVPPAPPARSLCEARVAIVTEGGIVPRGNPDRIESRRASRWAKVSIAGLTDLTPDAFECVHGGFDGQYANADPDRVVPLDALRLIERDGRIGRLHDYYYVSVGNAAPLTNARAFGRGIAEDLLKAGVQAVILTAT